MAKRRFVAYYRVSTARQGRSGLGLEAQKSAVINYLDGGRWELIAEFIEIESGRRRDRPELAKALDACRLHGATLVIAKLDRLARNVAFTAALMDSGVDFVAVDFPQANRLTIHILAAVAEHEAEAISTRTKAALAAAKARGKRLGNPSNLTVQGRLRGSQKGNEAKARQAARRAALVAPLVAELRQKGASSLRAIADGLNARGVPAPRGGVWSAPQVRSVLRRVPQQA